MGFTDLYCEYIGWGCSPYRVPQCNPDRMTQADYEQCLDRYYNAPGQDSSAINCEAGAPECDPANSSKNDYNLCLLERNMIVQRCLDNVVAESTLSRADDFLTVLDGNVSFSDNPVLYLRSEIMSSARRLYFQGDNWLLLSAAQLCLGNYFTELHQYQLEYHPTPRQTEVAREERLRELDRAIGYLQAALSNPSEGMATDWRDQSVIEFVTTPAIPHIEAYFELQTSLIEINILYASESPDQRQGYVRPGFSSQGQLMRERDFLPLVGNDAAKAAQIWEGLINAGYLNENGGINMLNFDLRHDEFMEQELTDDLGIPVELSYEEQEELYSLLAGNLSTVGQLVFQVQENLSSTRFLLAQGSFHESAEGYENRIRLAMISAYIYDQTANPDDLLDWINTSEAWANQAINTNLMTTWMYGRSLMDLRHDELVARMHRGRLFLTGRMRAEHQDEAAELFRNMLERPVTTRRYGGFLDIGTESMFYLLSLAMTDPATIDRETAAERFSELIGGEEGWYRLNNNNDFKETLGLLVRGRDWRDKIPQYNRELSTSLGEIPDPFESLGEWSLALGFDWGPPNWSPLRSVLTNIDLCGHVEASSFANLGPVSVDEATQDRIMAQLRTDNFVDARGTIMPRLANLSQEDFVRDFHVSGLTPANISAIYEIIQQTRPSYLQRTDILMRSLRYRHYNDRMIYPLVSQWQAWRESEI